MTAILRFLARPATFKHTPSPLILPQPILTPTPPPTAPPPLDIKRARTRSILFDHERPSGSTAYRSLRPKRLTRADEVFRRLEAGPGGGGGMGGDTVVGARSLARPPAGRNGGSVLHTPSPSSAIVQSLPDVQQSERIPDSAPEGTTDRPAQIDVERFPSKGKSSRRRSIVDPFQKLASSPPRKCRLTDARLPRDFLLRVKTRPLVRREVEGAIPGEGRIGADGEVESTFRLGPIEHPRYRSDQEDGELRPGKGMYVLCRKSTVETLWTGKKAYKRFPNLPSRSAPHLPSFPAFCARVERALRERVIQEVVLLGDRLRCLPRAGVKVANDQEGGTLRDVGRDDLKEGHVPSRREEEGSGRAFRWLDHEVVESLRTGQTHSPSTTPASDGANGLDEVIAILSFDEPVSSPGAATPREDRADFPEIDIHHVKLSNAGERSAEDAVDSSDVDGGPVLKTRGIPVYPTRGMFTEDEEYDRLKTHLRNAIRWQDLVNATAASKRRPRTNHLAVLCDPALLARGRDISTLPLFTALYRLRLWHGQGWTKDATGRASAEVDNERDEILAGFREVQGVMHTRWSV